MCKSLVYKHESEVRAVFNSSSSMMQDNSPHGQLIEVDLKALIQKVVISPLAPEWFMSIIENMCVKFSFNFQVEQSKVYTPPIY